jgi:translocation and assembly module TamB
VEHVDGEIPATAAFMLGGRSRPRPVKSGASNSYAELRFADQHPLSSRQSYLTIARLDTPWATFAPVAGNLVVDNDVFSLSQLELGVRGGRVGGRCVLVLKGRDSTIEASIRASGVRSSEGEPFDGNASLDIALRQRSVQGRAEILRIGKRHLLDLLDVADPARADPAINRVRRAMALGYPDHVRVAFNRGFASAKITLGGFAKLIKIDEIKGIPMGPIVDQFLGRFLDPEE